MPKPRELWWLFLFGFLSGVSVCNITHIYEFSLSENRPSLAESESFAVSHQAGVYKSGFTLFRMLMAWMTKGNVGI
jgi:hypothetical protein